jgi:hypothetical protein
MKALLYFTPWLSFTVKHSQITLKEDPQVIQFPIIESQVYKNSQNSQKPLQKETPIPNYTITVVINDRPNPRIARIFNKLL